MIRCALKEANAACLVFHLFAQLKVFALKLDAFVDCVLAGDLLALKESGYVFIVPFKALRQLWNGVVIPPHFYAVFARQC